MHAARQELGEHEAKSMPEPERSEPQQSEAGAMALIEAIRSSLPIGAVGEGDMRNVGLRYLRNQSHAPQAEFGAFTERLAAILTDAGEDSCLKFVSSDGETVHYELLGTAYLVTADGFDQWELFLRLSPAEEAWTIWQASDPVRLLTYPRPGRPQITQWPIR